MGKPYGHEYHFAPSNCLAGDMICAACHKPIDGENQDWRCHQKSKGGDWRYITMHRACCPDDPMWSKIEQKRKANADKHESILNELRHIFEKHHYQSAYSFALNAAEAAGEDLEDLI